MRKRVFDVLVSAAALVALAPLMVAITIAVIADSGRPVLFGHERVGRHGRRFTLYKFRSMRSNAGGPAVTVDGDARITRIGALLRRSKLDELPQLFNVLRGEMSLVGPRPEVGDYVDRHAELFRELLEARPGITDPASITFRDEQALLAEEADPLHHYESVILPEKVRLSTEYLRHATVRTDVRIILETIGAIGRR